MNRHNTPADIARILSRHLPRRFASVLEPAVGNGVLLEPLMTRAKGRELRIVCVDTDNDVLAQTAKALRRKHHANVECIHGDFLNWSGPRVSEDALGFDCIIMNPPFSGRKEEWREIDLDAELAGSAMGLRCSPIEVAFVARAARLLRPHGRLLAILPGSVVGGESTRWLRTYMSSLGAFRYVRELPHRTFPEVEARTYLVIFEKGGQPGHITLCNHDLGGRHRLRIPRSELGPDMRLDYRYQWARARYGRLIDEVRQEWMRLADVASIFRGTADSPSGVAESVHTCDFRAGFWRAAARHAKRPQGQSTKAIRKGDILVKRVGRGCSESFGKGVGIVGMACTDCVFVIRPSRLYNSSKLLFAIRCFLSGGWAKGLLERGTGAAYLTEAGLAELLIPADLCERYTRYFERYRAGLSSKTFSEMQNVEKHVNSRMHGAVFRRTEPASRSKYSSVPTD